MTSYMEKFKLDGETAVVCGGAGLIGKRVSIALGQAGAKVLVLDIDTKKGKRLEERHSNIKFIEFDITDIKNLKENMRNVYKKYGPIDVWVNTSYPRTKDWGVKLEDITVKHWRRNVDMHMNSYCLSTKEIAKLMKKDGIEGSIINYGSTYGVVGPDFEVYSGMDMTSPAAYSAIKGGINNFTKYIASYYGKYGIRANCLCPGGIFDNQNKKFVKEYKKRTPLRRMGKPEEIASATLFLASEASSYITGNTFMVDGGWTSI